MNKIEARQQALQRLAAEVAKLMEENDELGSLIETVMETEAESDLEAVKEAASKFRIHTAQCIGSMALISSQIDNSSASNFLMEVAKQFIEFNLENNPMDVLRGLVEND